MLWPSLHLLTLHLIHQTRSLLAVLVQVQVLELVLELALVLGQVLASPK
jgi:hypothetical protein